MDNPAEDIFAQALELDPENRQQFVDDACAGNHELRRQVDQLLMDAADAEVYFTKDFGGSPWVGPSHNFLMEHEGDWVGPYKLLQQIGEGGFGVVWMAEQSKPISRRVAVKVIKAGMDTKEVLSRFDAERQALARMDHPHIARVLDAGVTLTGRPYFAMELVKGIPITRFCDEQQLDAKERLVLFADVCSAINHAHQKGVIHRDVKPSNVLVTLDGDKPLVKVIDFGISKAIEGKLTDGTLFTRLEQWVGTPVYMSPEQAGLGSLDIDTRSDIYALGVLLYELLTGVPPFDQATLIKAGYEEMRRIIREEEPIRPSLRLTSLHAEKAAPIAAARRVSRDRLHRMIASDLDWIVMKAIDKSRERRYDTAAALAEDIGRFLADKPVAAKPPSAFYLFGKFAKRHRSGFRVACGFAVLLVGTAVISTREALRATKAEDFAQQRLHEAVAARNAKESALQDAQAVSRLLTEVFKRPDPEIDGRKVTVVEALDAATEKLNTELAGQPERLAMLLEVLAGTYERLALDDKSLVLRKKVLEIRRNHPGIEHSESMDSLRRMIVTSERLGHHLEARSLAEEEVSLLRRLQGNNNEQTLVALGSLASNSFLSNEREKAITIQQELLDRTSAIHGKEAQQTRIVRWQLDQYRRQSGHEPKGGVPANKTTDPHKTDTTIKVPTPAVRELSVEHKQAIEELEKKLAQAREKLGPAHLKTLDAQRQLTELYFGCRQWEDAIRHQTQAFAAAREKYGPLDEMTLELHDRLAQICNRADRKDDAIRIQEQLLALKREKYGENNPATLIAETQLLAYLRRTEKHEKSNEILIEILDRRRKAYNPEDLKVLSLQAELALRFFCAGKFQESLTQAEEVVPLLRRIAGDEDRGTLDAISNLGRCYAATGRSKKAVELLTECCPKMRDDTFVNLMLANLQLWSGLNGEYNQTRRWMMDYAKIHRDRYKSRHDILQRGILICCLAPFENATQGKELLLTLERADAIQSAPNAPLDYGPDSAWRNVITGIAYYRTGDHAKAITLLDGILLSKDEAKADRTWEHNMAGFYKAMALHDLGQKETGRELFEATAKTMRLYPSEDHPLLNSSDASGAPLTYWLAYREAKKRFDESSRNSDSTK